MQKFLRASIKALFDNHGWHFKRIPEVEFFRHHKIDLVIDVGANEGQYAEQLRRRGYRGQIMSFEPVSDAFAILERKSASDSGWSVFQSALGSTLGEAEINISHSTVFSSFNEINDLGSALSKDTVVVRRETVPITTLDRIAGTETARRPFLKIDTQGFEQKVLEGGATFLNRCEGLQLELPIGHIYDGVWNFREALAYVEALGFVPAQFAPINPMPDDPTSAIEFDCIFRRIRPTAL